MENSLSPGQKPGRAKNIVVIVAHPDDETLWAGGTILSHPSCNWFIVSACRGSDNDRAPKFQLALKALKSEGIMGDLNDGPEQLPQNEKLVMKTILGLLPDVHFDLVITHNPTGEYTSHLRHEEISNAVIKLWVSGKLSTRELWTFAYEDGNREYYAKAIGNATFCRILSKRVWQKKYNIITKIYGFGKESFEAETTPQTEAFWQFTNPHDAETWLTNGGIFI